MRAELSDFIAEDHRRPAVRFSAPLFPGETLTTRAWRTDGLYCFEALGGDGRRVLRDGLAQL